MMNRLHRLTVLFALLLGTFCSASATVYQSDADGDWSVTATWNGGIVPPNVMTALDTVEVNHNVTLGADLVLTPGGRLTIGVSGHLDLTGYNLVNQSNGGGLNLGAVNVYGRLTCDYLRNYGFSWIFVEPGGYLRVYGDVDNLGDIYISGILEVINGDFNHRAADIWVFGGGLVSIMNGDFNNYSTIRNLFPSSCIGILDGSFINHKGAFITGQGGIAAADNVDNSANAMSSWVGVTWCAGGLGINVDPLLEDCAGPCNSILPVEIAHFDARAQADGQIRLVWSTTMETNSLRFRVERTVDLRTFETVAEMDAAGNSNELRSYELMDADHPGGLVHYRLTEIDLEGLERSHGQLVSAFVELAAQPFVAYPNPVVDDLTIQVGAEKAGQSEIKVVDLTGAVVLRVPVTSSQQQIDFQALPAGLYLVQLQTGSHIESMKVYVD